MNKSPKNSAYFRLTSYWKYGLRSDSFHIGQGSGLLGCKVECKIQAGVVDGGLSMGAKMKNAPVFYTLAQVKFNPIAQMEDYVPHLQEHLRRGGYPDYRKEVVQVGLKIRQLDKEEPEVKGQQHIQWSFTNAQRNEGYLLSADSLVFHSTVYETFDVFSNRLLERLSLVHEAVELAYIERIGLRYLDAVIPKGDDVIDAYLNPSLLGLSLSIEGELKHSFSETLSQIKGGMLVARSVITSGGLALPPDLFPLKLEIQPQFSEIPGPSAVLDTDYFVKKRFDFDLEMVKVQLLSSHDIIDRAFHLSVTDYARHVWG